MSATTEFYQTDPELLARVANQLDKRANYLVARDVKRLRQIAKAIQWLGRLHAEPDLLREKFEACPLCHGDFGLFDEPVADGARCRVCGCTDDDCSECVERTGEPCSWVEADLCSACVPAPSKQQGGEA